MDIVVTTGLGYLLSKIFDVLINEIKGISRIHVVSP